MNRNAFIYNITIHKVTQKWYRKDAELKRKN